MEPIVSYHISRKIPVAQHLNDQEYMDFLDEYAFFCGSKPEKERLKYCSDQIRSVEREQDMLVVTYNNGTQFTVGAPDTEKRKHDDPSTI